MIDGRSTTKWTLSNLFGEGHLSVGARGDARELGGRQRVISRGQKPSLHVSLIFSNIAHDCIIWLCSHV